MAENVVFYKQYGQSEEGISTINRGEIRRYAGMFGKEHIGDNRDRDEIEAVMEECIKEALPLLTYKISYRYEPVTWTDGNPKLIFEQKSENLGTNLQNCEKVVLFAATIGLGIDRLIARYGRISPVKALFLQAIGAERIETLCDTFNAWVKEEALKEGMTTVARFSPGYGDLPLAVQKDFMTLLDCSRRIGVTLNDSLLMTPSKSVTAIIGIKPAADGADAPVWDNGARCLEKKNISKCATCPNTECEYRRV